MEKQRKYLGKFETKEEADKCAEEKNGFVKKQTYKSGGEFFTFWYVYPKFNFDGEDEARASKGDYGHAMQKFDEKILGGKF